MLYFILKKITVHKTWNALENALIGRDGSGLLRKATSNLKAIEKKIYELNKLAESADSDIRFKFETYEISDKND